MIKQQPRILVVDDSEIIRRSLAQELSRFEAEVVTASDGQEAVALAETGTFDLVITEARLEGLDGFEFCRTLKSSEATAATRIVFLASRCEEGDIEASYAAGADAYVSKADGKERLLEQVEELLEEVSLQAHSERTILVVEDSPTITAVLVKQLREEGFGVLTAANGEEGLKILEETHPNLILSDIQMPVMDGREFCLKVHSDPDLASIPFVVMSTVSERDTMRQMLRYGAEAYLVKPFNPDQLIVTIEKLLSDHYLMLLQEKETLDLERKMMLASITSLIQALEARDNYTRGHSENVSRLVGLMGQAAGLSALELHRLRVGGRLHDLGKIGVRDTILLKPGKLTDGEYAMIKLHPVIGARILDPIPSLKDMLPIVLHHHERLDGKGYPEGLKGSEIPLMARMTAVADTYDALTSDRAYRKGMNQADAMGVIDGVRGSQLCPDCVDLMLKVLENEPEPVAVLPDGRADDPTVDA